MSDFPEMAYKATEPEDVLPEVDAHGYLQGVYRGLIKPNGSRLRAAVAAIAYERPKFSVTANLGEQDIGERLRSALAATGKVIDGRAVETKPAQVGLPAPVQEPLV